MTPQLSNVRGTQTRVRNIYDCNKDVNGKDWIGWGETYCFQCSVRGGPPTTTALTLYTSTTIQGAECSNEAWSV